MVLLLALALLAGDPHVIEVVDDASGRGVPLVELRTVNKTRFVTDSAGIVAFDEPGMMDRKVFFTVSSHGYEWEKDGFGFRGAAIETKTGGKSTIRIKRLNIAERLYRVTGQGIYGESVKAGLKAPIREPALNGGVLGQDTVQTIAWKGKLWWFWGDTLRAGYPLGNFAASGATSELPGKGGLDPSVGVDLKYWVDAEGFSRGMVRGLDAPPGPIWIFALMILKDESGTERLVADYVVVKTLGVTLQRGLCVWDEAKEQFGPLSTYPIDEPLHPGGQPIRIRDEDGERFYFPSPDAIVRVKADWKAVQDPKQYEAFTCLQPGTRYRKGQAKLDRDAGGTLTWAWKKETGPVTEKDQEELIKAGAMKPAEAWYRLKDREGDRVLLHGGTVCWNESRKRWILIALQAMGRTSLLGEVWYAEAERPWGPFERGVKVVTHDKYTFYNVVQHPEFDQDGGRRIYFEGTYTAEFSGNKDPTPRYDYNQIMYRLDLADERLKPAQPGR